MTAEQEVSIRGAFTSEIADEWLRRATTVRRVADLLRGKALSAPRKRR